MNIFLLYMQINFSDIVKLGIWCVLGKVHKLKAWGPSWCNYCHVIVSLTVPNLSSAVAVAKWLLGIGFFLEWIDQYNPKKYILSSAPSLSGSLYSRRWAAWLIPLNSSFMFLHKELLDLVAIGLYIESFFCLLCY